MRYEPPKPRETATAWELIEEAYDIIHTGFMRLHAQEREVAAIIEVLAGRRHMTPMRVVKEVRRDQG